MAAIEDDRQLIARLEKDLRTANAAQRVNSLISLQVLMRVAVKTDDSRAFVSSVMEEIERELWESVRSGETPTAKRDAEDAVTFFNVLKAGVARSMSRLPLRGPR